MKSYTTEEKHSLFTDIDATPTVRAFSGTYTNKGTKPTAQRQCTSTVCPCCDISGHDANTTGCLFAASFLLTTTYLQNNSRMKRSTITTFKQYQQSRLNKLKK